MQITPVSAADNGHLPVLFPCRWSPPGIVAACETQFVSQPELLLPPAPQAGCVEQCNSESCSQPGLRAASRPPKATCLASL